MATVQVGESRDVDSERPVSAAPLAFMFDGPSGASVHGLASSQRCSSPDGQPQIPAARRNLPDERPPAGLYAAGLFTPP
jgi:hypothetical protein